MDEFLKEGHVLLVKFLDIAVLKRHNFCYLPIMDQLLMMQYGDINNHRDIFGFDYISKTSPTEQSSRLPQVYN